MPSPILKRQSNYYGSPNSVTKVGYMRSAFAARMNHQLFHFQKTRELGLPSLVEDACTSGVLGVWEGTGGGYSWQVILHCQIIDRVALYSPV